MIFWRKKKNISEQEREEREDRVVHHPDDPAIEPPTEYEAEMSPDFVEHELEEPESEIIDEMNEVPVPEHTSYSDVTTEEEERVRSGEATGGGWFSRLKQGLTKSTTKISKGLGDFLTKRKLDEAALEEIEDLLISADLGPQTAQRLVEALSSERFGREVTDVEIRQTLAREITAILQPVTAGLMLDAPEEGGPRTILVTGVNGVGKTTTIGKLAHQIHYTHHKSVMIAAGDTFRAAAQEQLQIWADRVHVPLVAKEIGADAASVAYEAYEKAKGENSDILLIDTAGRLHNKGHLMEELQKIARVLKKQNEHLPHEVLLVLDATTGQNAHAQVETFKEMVNVTGLVVTKLDGSAKGGVVVSLAHQFGLPIYAIGVGEGVEDLQPFHPDEFARSLVGLSESDSWAEP